VGLFKKIFKQAKSDIAGGLDLLSAGFSHPIMTIKDPVKAVKLTRKEGATKTIGRTIRTTALTAAALNPAGAVRTLGRVGIKASPKLVLGGLTAAGIVSTSKKGRKALDIATNPATPFLAGQTIGKVVEGKPVSIEEGLTAGGLVGGAAAATGLIIGGGAILKGKGKKLIPSLPNKDVVGSAIPQPNKDIIESPVGMVKPTTPTEKPLPKPPKIDIDIDIDNRTSNKKLINAGVVVN